MVRFLDWRKQTSKDFLGVEHGNDWGDWLSFGGKTPLAYIDTVYFAYSAKLMAIDMAAPSKKRRRAMRRRTLQEYQGSVQPQICETGWHDHGRYQTARARALHGFDAGESAAARGCYPCGENPVERQRTNSGITTGFLGTRPLPPMLSKVATRSRGAALSKSCFHPGDERSGRYYDLGALEQLHQGERVRRRAECLDEFFSHYSFGAVCERMFLNWPNRQRLAVQGVC
jgi:alpha-L-rhamnosidase